MESAETDRRRSARLRLDGSGAATAETGLPVLDHLLEVLAASGGFDLTLELAPGDADADVIAAGRALGEALHGLLRANGARGHAAAAMPADEALAHVVLEASGRPLVATNVDLSEARVGGLGTDLAARFLGALAESAGLTLHVRLIEGDDTQHVLEAIFKALGVALAQACRPARKESR